MFQRATGFWRKLRGRNNLQKCMQAESEDAVKKTAEAVVTKADAKAPATLLLLLLVVVL